MLYNDSTSSNEPKRAVNEKLASLLLQLTENAVLPSPMISRSCLDLTRAL